MRTIFCGTLFAYSTAPLLKELVVTKTPFDAPGVASIEDFLALVQKDEHGCFFG
jgi:hypothetical protein